MAIVEHTPVSQAADQRAGIPNGLLLLFFISIFFPYPAVGIGNSTGLQLNQALAIAGAPFLFARGINRAHFLTFACLFFPFLLSELFMLMFNNQASEEISINSLISTFIYFVPLLMATMIRGVREFRLALVAASLAILFHFGFGIVQYYYFLQNEFPFLELFYNPSFGTFDRIAETYATYVKRPMGYFPEPSAMAASIGPWILLAIGLMAHPSYGAGLSSKAKSLIWTASLCGLCLILLSRSGFSFAFLALFALASWPMIKGHMSQLHKIKSLLIIGFIFSAIVGVGIAGVELLQERADFSTNISFQSRLTSIILGISVLAQDPVYFLIGVGPGQSGIVLQDIANYNILFKDATVVTSVWSVWARFVMETGLTGIIAMLFIFISAIKAISRSSLSFHGGLAFIAWLVGTILTTSYISLSPLWLLLGVLVTLDTIFPKQPRPSSVEPPSAKL